MPVSLKQTAAALVATAAAGTGAIAATQSPENAPVGIDQPAAVERTADQMKLDTTRDLSKIVLKNNVQRPTKTGLGDKEIIIPGSDLEAGPVVPVNTVESEDGTVEPGLISATSAENTTTTAAPASVETQPPITAVVNPADGSSGATVITRPGA